ncbi:MAG: complex I subunit 1 family protein [Planctomycetota bacterium]
MNDFTPQDALRSRWKPDVRPKAVRWFAGLGVIGVLAGAALLFVASQVAGLGYLFAVLAAVIVGLGGVTFLVAAVAVMYAEVVGALLLKAAFPIFLVGVVGIMVVAWAPALLYGVVDRADAAQDVAAQAATTSFRGELTVVELYGYLAGGPAGEDTGAARSGPWMLAAYALWPLQFQLVRDVLSALGILGFVSIVGAFGIWWERKVAGRMQSRLGPMRVGGWHGWAQSMADGLKLLQKEDIFIGGSDRPLFRLAVYIAWLPAVALFLALPFSAAWVGRDLDIGVIFIFAMLGIGVLGVLLAGWASNNKWSMFGAMREACQMISYEIPLGFSLLIPVMYAGTLRLTDIGKLQDGGLHTWLAFQNPFLLAAAVLFFTATLAEVKRAPFDLPEAESELVAGYLTEFSGFRWALFFFAEYAEMFAVSALAALLFFGAWHSPLPAEWGAAWANGPLWQQALHGILFGGPLWLVGKGFFFFFVQLWLRWTLPRIRLDQVMYACVQAMLPVAMVLLLGNTLWGLLVPRGSWVAGLTNVVCTAVGVLAAIGVVATVVYGLRRRRELVGTLAIEHLPGA